MQWTCQLLYCIDPSVGGNADAFSKKAQCLLYGYVSKKHHEDLYSHEGSWATIVLPFQTSLLLAVTQDRLSALRPIKFIRPI